jgi:DNA-binding NtrC family response regulator
VRLIAATNRDIVQAIRQNAFREDLFHRLNVVQFRPPPLRERGDDILLLANHFLRAFASAMNKPITAITPAAQQKLLGHHWPGNVRELRNVIERAVILEHTVAIEAENLPDFAVENRLRRGEPPGVRSPGGDSLEEHLAAYERDLILRYLRQNDFALTPTADQLGVSVQTLRYRLQTLNISVSLTPEEDSQASAEPER